MATMKIRYFGRAYTVVTPRSVSARQVPLAPQVFMDLVV
jgi:hypothetical protein